MKMSRRTPVVLCLAAAFCGLAAAGSFTIAQSGGGNIVGGSTDTGNHCDDCVTSIALPFTVTLYGTGYNNATVTSNGAIYFGSGTNSNFGTIPDATFSDAIFPFWQDQCTTSNDCGNFGQTGSQYGIFTSTTGVGPNQIFNVEWVTYDWNDAGVNEFELHLYQGQANFDVVYDGASFPSTATIGVQHDGVDFTVFQNSTGLECGSSCAGVALGQSVVGQQGTTTTLTFSTAQTGVPEPATLALIGLGLIAIPVARKLRRK